jgi:predicted methyltransferase
MNFMEENMAANIGFVMGNKQRERIMQVLSSKGKLSAEKIAKFEHIPLAGVNKILKELAQKNILFEEGGNWSLTDRGHEIDKEMKKRK